MPAWVRATPNTTIPGVLTNRSRTAASTDGLNNWETVGQVAISTANPNSAPNAARMGAQGVPYTGVDLLEQYSVRIPYVLNQGTFTFWWRSEATGNVADPEDVFRVEILDGSDVVVQVLNVNNIGDTRLAAGNVEHGALRWPLRHRALLPDQRRRRHVDDGVRRRRQG